MKTTKNLNFALLTLGCLLFIFSSTFAQRNAKVSEAYNDKPVYQINLTKNCDGSVDDPSKCAPVGLALNAGQDDIICSSESYTLNGTSPKNLKTLWKSSGDGTFDDPTKLDAVYTPGDYDKFSGEVTLYLNAASKTSLDKVNTYDSMVLSIELCTGVEDVAPEN